MHVGIEDIKVPQGRRPLRNIEALAESISTVGLINPIVVTEDLRLVAGNHRLEACKKLGWKEIPTTVMTGTEIDAELIEIDENLQRYECTVLERAEMRARRKELYEAKYPQTRHGGAPGMPGGGKKAKTETISTFANREAELKKTSSRTIRHEVQIARSIPADVRDRLRDTPLSDSKNDLLTLARLDEDSQRRVTEKLVAGAKSVKQVLFEEARERVAAQSRLRPEKANIVQQDALDFLERLAPESVDLLLTDPPTCAEVEDVDSFAASWVPLALSRVKPSGRAYILTGAYPVELQAYLRVLGDQQTLTLANVMAWVYFNTLGPKPTYDYNLNWQAIFYLRGGQVPPLDCTYLMEQCAVQHISAPDGRQGTRLHACQKPVVLAERFVRHATRQGELVVDPFAGTGTFLLEAARLGRQTLGCENDPQMFQLALHRGCVHAP